MTWPEVDAQLARSRGIIVPLGSLEQHGPAGLVGTDSICAMAVAERAAALAGVVTAPVLSYTPAQFNLGFPGTISLKPSTLMAVLCDVLVSLGRTGFSRIFLLSGHGANMAPALAAIQEVMGEISTGRLNFSIPITVKLRAWWDGPRLRDLRETLYGDREGFHATASEIAISAALYPGEHGAWPAYRAVAPDPLIDLGGDRHEDSARHRARYPDGIVGADPSLARGGDGARLLEAAAADVADLLAAFAGAPEFGDG